MKNIDGTVNNSLLFTAQIHGAKIYFTKTGISYVLYKPAVNTTLQEDSTYRMEVLFKNAGSNVICVGSNPEPSYSNYFIGLIEKRNITEFQNITYSNIWSNISLVVSLNETGLSYKYVIGTGANASNIQLEFKGGYSFSFINGNMTAILPFNRNLQISKFSTNQNVNSITPSSIISSFSATKIWSVNALGLNIDSSYEINQNILNFNAGSQQQITPPANNNQWATYYGGTSNDVITDVFISESDFIYVSGYTNSSDFPDDPSGTVYPYQGSDDIFISKFKPNRERIFSTYFGGNDEDRAHSLAVNSRGEIYFAGFTRSGNYTVFPGNTNAYFNNQLSQYNTNGIITKLSGDGQYNLWSTSIGSTGYDEVNAITFGSDDKLYIVGETSSTNFPTKSQSGGFNQTYNQCVNTQGSKNGFICRFSNRDSLEWSTYFGGRGDDYFESCVVDKFNNLIILGNSNSSDVNGNCGIYVAPMPICGNRKINPSYTQLYSGTAQNTYADQYIAKFNPQAQITWATFYGGPGGEFNELHSSNTLMTDAAGDIYITGQTTGGLPMPNFGNNQTIFGGGYDAYLVRFDNLGIRKWSTYLGGNSFDRGTAIVKGINQTYMVVGSTSSLNFPKVNQIGTYYSASLNSTDGFLTIYSNTNTMLHSTNIGGLNDDHIYSISSSNEGQKVVLGGMSSGSNFPVRDFSTSNTLDYFDPSFNQFSDGFIMNLVYPNPCSTNPITCRTAGIIFNKNNYFNIYPNPSNGIIMIELKDINAVNEINVFDQQGKLIFTKNNLINNELLTIDLSKFAKGLYLVKFNSDLGIKTQKIILQ